MSRKRIIFSIASFIASIVITFTFLSSVVLAYSPFSIGKDFDNHTYVGPFTISHQKVEQAHTKLASDFIELQNKLEVNLIYQDVQFSLPSETVNFNIDMTLANAQSGKDNPIIADVTREGLRTVLNQQLPEIGFSEEGVDSIAAGIEQELQKGFTPTNVYITDYLATDIQSEVVASSVIKSDGISPALSKALQAFDDSVIQPFESFSMLEFLTSSEVGPLTDEELTLLSSVFYTAILQTNFVVEERNISAAPASDIQPGFEAAVNQTLGLDLKFTNPNKTEYTFRAAWSAGAIHLSIEGMPLYYTYEPTVMNVETYSPRIVRQYSAFVDEGQALVTEEGKEGVEAIVIRTLSVDGQVVHTEDISADFYAPVNRVETHPLSKEEATVNDGEDSGECRYCAKRGFYC